MYVQHFPMMPTIFRLSEGTVQSSSVAIYHCDPHAHTIPAALCEDNGEDDHSLRRSGLLTFRSNTPLANGACCL
jgi:hypothetical protein